MTQKKTPPTKRTTSTKQSAPFLDHLFELRRRLFIVAASIVGFSALAYFFENRIIFWLLKPAHGEKFIYTSPGGGIDFLIKVCLYVGIILSAPIIIYQLLRFIQPLIGPNASRFIWFGSAAAGLLALGGIAFGYFFGLPVALQFLLNQFQVSEITALITISSYLSFVIAYLAGASLIFQLPLWMYCINKIKPLKPSTLMKNQRWVILVSFIVAAIINPSPRPQDLFLLAVPIIASYEVGAILVWHTNRKRNITQTAQPIGSQPPETPTQSPVVGRQAPVVATSISRPRPRAQTTFMDIAPARRVAVAAPIRREPRYINDFLPARRVQS